MRVFLSLLLFFALSANGQVADSVSAKKDTSLLQMMDGVSSPATQYTRGTFLTTRLINGHSVETLGKHVLDIKISHRFGLISGGFYQFFGLDQADIRIGGDYGITDWLTVGGGRSSFEKLYDGFLKAKLLRQSKGEKKMPITLALVGGIYVATDTNYAKTFADQTSYVGQVLIARKFSEGFSLQLMPSWVHYNLVPNAEDPHDTYAIGIGGRQKISRRLSINVEYYYRFPGTTFSGTVNPLSIGFDIGTGGHVFQLMFTNSTGIAENQYISNTRSKWADGDIHFGFNISRVFTLGGKKKEEAKKQ